MSPPAERWVAIPRHEGGLEVSDRRQIRRVSPHRGFGDAVRLEPVLSPAEVEAMGLDAEALASAVWGPAEAPQRVEVDGASFVSPDAGVTWTAEVADGTTPDVDDRVERPREVVASAAPEFPTGRVADAKPERAAPTLPPEAPKDSRKGKRERR
jgi:hypothetical protein